MQRLATFASPASTVEELAAAIAEHPAYVQYYTHELSRSGQSKLRARLRAADYDQAQISVLAPAQVVGRPIVRKEDRHFDGLSAPVKGAIADALGLDLFPVDPAAWQSPETADIAAGAVAAHFTNPTSTASALTHLRNGLKAINAPKAVVTATLRPEITREHNANTALRHLERVGEGLIVPEPFRTIEGLRTRVANYLGRAQWAPDGQAAADLLVTMSARPGEASTLDIGDRGGVVGVLKKRGVEESYPIVSALGEDTARAFLAAWKASPGGARRDAMRQLVPLTASWGIQRRDLRAVGVHLAQRAAILGGDAANPAQLRDVAKKALRHVTQGPQAVDHYQRINDPTAELGARLAELSLEDLARVHAIIGK